MKVEIDISESTKGGRFANVNLKYIDLDGNARYVPAHIDFRSLNDFSKDLTSVAFDFFMVASLAYCVDNLLERESYSVDGWAREIEVAFPVNNHQIWNQNKEKFEALLSFLTGDYWTITFSALQGISIFKELKGRWKSKIPSYDHTKFVFASLFSGGLDSLVGVINELEKLQNNQQGLLLSHYDGSSPGTNRDQEILNNYLAPRYRNKFDWVQEGVYLSNSDIAGNKIPKESSFRSRSLLFIAIGIFCLQETPNCSVLIVPENGTISLNYPLTPSRSSSLSTRTTHPFYVGSLNSFLSVMGIKTTVFNPYDNLTKGELVNSCVNQPLLRGIYKESVSCGKRGRKGNWDRRSGTNHCGVCMPCIYRRAALNVIGLDNQLYGTDIFDTGKNLGSITDLPALIDFIKNPSTPEQIKRTLLANGSFTTEQLDKFAPLITNVKSEIKNWIRSKGGDEVKKIFGLT